MLTALPCAPPSNVRMFQIKKVIISFISLLLCRRLPHTMPRTRPFNSVQLWWRPILRLERRYIVYNYRVSTSPATLFSYLSYLWINTAQLGLILKPYLSSTHLIYCELMSNALKYTQRSKRRTYPKTLAPKFRIVAAKIRLLIECCFSRLGWVITAIFGYVIGVLVI
jgi:hypothetical protein